MKGESLLEASDCNLTLSDAAPAPHTQPPPRRTRCTDTIHALTLKGLRRLGFGVAAGLLLLIQLHLITAGCLPDVVPAAASQQHLPSAASLHAPPPPHSPRRPQPPLPTPAAMRGVFGEDEGDDRDDRDDGDGGHMYGKSGALDDTAAALTHRFISLRADEELLANAAAAATGRYRWILPATSLNAL